MFLCVFERTRSLSVYVYVRVCVCVCVLVGPRPYPVTAGERHESLSTAFGNCEDLRSA